MKTLLTIIIILGIIVLYLLGAAFHLEYFDTEMLVHITVRFVIGFVVLGIWVFYKRRLKLTVALYCVLALLVLDDIIDYIRHINNLSFEMVIFDTFIVFWGSLVGFIYMRWLKKRLGH